MLSAIVGGSVSRGQQLPTSEAASFLLAQELCIRLRSRRVTRAPAQSRPSQPQAVPSPHRHGEQDQQMSMSEAGPHLPKQELQCKRVTRTSVHCKPLDPAPIPRTRNLNSSRRTVRKPNYRKVANPGLVGSPEDGIKRWNVKPRKGQLAADREERSESRVNRKKQASAKLSREVGLEQRKRTGAVGKSHSVVWQSKPHSVVNPGSNQADGEVGHETWSSAISDVLLKAEFPQVYIQSRVHPAGLSAGEDDSNCGTAPSVNESGRADDRSVMDNCEGGLPATNVHRETRCSPPRCSSVQQSARSEHLLTALANEMCTENGAGGDSSEESTGPKIPRHGAAAMHVGVEETRRVAIEGQSTAGALKGNELIVVPLQVAPSEKRQGIDSIHKVPLKGIATSDVPDWNPPVAIATNHLLTGSDVTGETLACSGATIRTLAQNGLAPCKAAAEKPVEDEVTNNAPAECVWSLLEGKMINQHGTCANLEKDQLSDRSVDAVPSESATEDEVAEIVLLGVAMTNGPTKGALIEASSDNTETMGDEATTAMPGEGVRASETLAESWLIPEVLKAEETTSELPTQDKFTDVPTTAMPSHLATADIIKPVSLGVVAARCTLPKCAVPEVTPDVAVTVESGITRESPVERAVPVVLGESKLADAEREVSAGVELTMGMFYDVATDDELMKRELADIPTDITAVAMEIYTAGDPAVEVDGELGGRLLHGNVLEAVEPTRERVMYEDLVDGELVDIPTDVVINDLTREEVADEAGLLEVAPTNGEVTENELFAPHPDTITKKISGSTNAVNSCGVTISWVFSGDEFLRFSPGSSASLEDERVGVVPGEGVMRSSLAEEKRLVKSPHDTKGLVTTGLPSDDVEGELPAARNPLGKGFKSIVESKVSSGGFSSIQTFQNEESKALMSKGHSVCTCSESVAMCCEDDELRAVESSKCKSKSVLLPVTNLVHGKCVQQPCSVASKRDQRTEDGRADLGEFGTVPVNKAAAICSYKRVFGCKNKRKGFVRLKRRKLNRMVLFSNCTPSFPKLEKFCLNRTSAYVDFSEGGSNCTRPDFDHRVQHVEEIKPKNLSLLPLHDLAHRKLCQRPLLWEHLPTIASGLRVLSKYTEVQQEFSATSKLVSVAVGRRFEAKGIEELRFCFSSQQASSWDVFWHLLTPRKDRPIGARVCRNVRPWVLSRNCKQTVHFGSPVSSNLDLILLLSVISDGDRVDQHGVSERTSLSIVPQHWSQDLQTLPQCQASFGQTLRPPASQVRTVRCCCTCSRFGLHTLLALSSPACYRLWTRQRHLGRVSNAQQPHLTLFGEGGKRLVPSDKSIWPPSFDLTRVMSPCSQHIPSPCTSTSDISPSNGWRHSRLPNSPSYVPPCLLTGNGASLSEAKSLLLQQTNKRSDLQHLSFACIVEPFLALPDPPTSSAECTAADSTFPSASSPGPIITYVETQLHTDQKEDCASPNKSVSKSKESLRKVSQIRIRKTIPKQDTNLTPMGLPKPKRLKKKEFSLEEIYTNQNYKSPSAHSKYLETIFEEPVLKKGSFVCTSLQKRKRLLEFQDYTLPRKRRAHAGVKGQSRTRAGKATTREEEIDSLLVQKLTELEAFLAGEDEGH